jgi:hypothetical protein
VLGPRLHRVFAGQAPARLRAINPALRPGQSLVKALLALPAPAVQGFAAKLRGWLVPAFAQFLKSEAARIVTASEDPAEGITFVFTVERPPGLKALGRAMAGDPAAASTIADALAKADAPNVRVEVLSGRHRG